MAKMGFQKVCSHIKKSPLALFYQNSPILVATGALNHGVPLTAIDRSIDGKLTTILIFVVQDAEVTRAWVLFIYRRDVSPFSRCPVNELSHSVRI